ncbi:MAG: hypothetical protein QN147_11430 [Armatimonadota bacterium]|nr:hypothetical protein [Armatimonadota bacterium]
MTDPASTSTAVSRGPEEPAAEPRSRFGPHSPNTIALLIACISIAGALAAARAAWEAQDATLLERRHVQALMLKQRRTLDIQSRVDHDHRLAALYTALDIRADGLQRDADRLRATQPDRAATLALQAQEERALRRALFPYFRLDVPVATEGGLPDHDKAAILQRRLAADSELREIDADIAETAVLLDRAHQRAWLMEACVAILVLSLVFLTLAMAVVGGAHWRGPLVGLGIGFGAMGLAVGLLVETGWIVDLFLKAGGH